MAYQNKALVYAILFGAVAETLKTIAADPNYLGGELGFIAILDTWGQTLTHHPHIHCLVPGGALSPDHKRWIPCGKHFFLPIHVLSCLFRRLFLQWLKTAHAAGRLHFFGALGSLRARRWIVYAKPPFGSPEHVLAYLGRYTHRVAIANSRLAGADGNTVAFRWRDYRHGNALKLMSLDTGEFIRRFLLHSLPDGFHRIRHYGLLANGCRRTKLAHIRQMLAAPKSALVAGGDETIRPFHQRSPFDPTLCPCCGGMLRITATLPPRGKSIMQQYPDTS